MGKQLSTDLPAVLVRANSLDERRQVQLANQRTSIQLLLDRVHMLEEIVKGDHENNKGVCQGCGEKYPCPTIKAAFPTTG